MKDNIKKAVKEYQCSGCINGYDPVESGCFKPCDTGCGCGAHRAGTFMLAVGKLFLGMPKGFNRLGKDNEIKVFHQILMKKLMKICNFHNFFSYHQNKQK